MGRMGEYVLSVLCVSLICGLVSRLLSPKGVQGKLVQMLCSILLILSIVSPLAGWSFRSWEDLRLDVQQSANAAAEQGKNEVDEQYRQVITQRTSAYILDKADRLGLALEVSVELSEERLAEPKAVTLRGKVSPYAKKVLSDWLTEELGIEDQVWISS